MKVKYILIVLSLIFALSTQATVAIESASMLERARDTLRERVSERTASLPAWLQFLRSGRVALASGELTAIDGTTLTVTRGGTAFTVLTDERTIFRRKFWGKSDLDEFSVGDLLNVVGTWTDETQTQIRARFIRNLSLQRRYGVFFGTVVSKTATGFTMDTIVRGVQTITVDEGTSFINRRQQSISFLDIAVGHRVRVRGLWDSTISQITEVTQIKNFSLPPRATPLPSP